MPNLSPNSKRELSTCHPDLQKVLKQAIEFFDFTVLKGHRTEEEQDEAVRKGFSKVNWPQGKHNSVPSHGVDIAPWVRGQGIPWANSQLFHYMAGIVMGIAVASNVKLRWGGDWNRNNRSGDESFKDLGHFELDHE